MTTPHTPPAALDVAATRDLMSADEARSLLAAMTPGTLEVAEIRDGRLIDAAPQELAVVIHDDARAHQKPDGTWHSVIVCRGMDGPAREANAAAFVAVKRALATVAALAAQPVPTLDVAAIEARAAQVAHALETAQETRVLVARKECAPQWAKIHDNEWREASVESAADVPTLLAALRTERAQHAAAVAAAVAAERSRYAALRDAATDVVESLSKREDACRASAKEAPAGEVRSRLMGKTSAYGHAAELLTRALLDADAIAATPATGGA